VESEESQRREKEAWSEGLEWAHDAVAGQTFALIAQDPWAFASTSGEFYVPKTYREAMKRPDLWWRPMEIEYETLVSKDVWELVPLPPDANLVGGKWIWTIKWGPKGEVLKRKARYVAQGYTQVYGIDYEETYGGVARVESM
jgi:hypothetical protein